MSHKRRRKGQTDPNKPTRWRSSYLYYCAEQRPIVKAANLSAISNSITIILGAGWTALTDKQKLPYHAQSKADKERYLEQMKTYVAPVSLESSSSSSSSSSSATSGGQKNPKLGSSAAAASVGKKDPNKPKRWCSSYLFYCAEQRPIVKAANPSVGNNDHVRIMGQGWSALTDKQKLPYQAQSTADKDRYLEQMKTYVAPAGSVSLKSSSSSSSSVQKIKRAVDPNKPKQGTTAYLFYCREHRPLIKSANPREIMTLLGSGWSSLTKEQKLPYHAKAKVEKDKYLKAMETYKEKNQNVPGVVGESGGRKKTKGIRL
jgi:hypothetical protein